MLASGFRFWRIFAIREYDTRQNVLPKTHLPTLIRNYSGIAKSSTSLAASSARFVGGRAWRIPAVPDRKFRA